MRLNKKYLFLLCGVLIAFLLSGDFSQAAVSNAGVFSDINTKFAQAASQWQTVILNYAEWLFWVLGTITLVITFGQILIKGAGKADIQEFIVAFVQFILVFGFFYWLLKKGPYIAGTIIDSLLKIGSQASGTGATNSSGVVDVGFNIFDKILDGLSVWNPGLSLLAALIGVLIIVILALVAANLTIEYCAAWVLLYGGCFFLAFGGSRWTQDMALAYFRSVLSSAVRLMSMILIIGITSSIVTSYAAQMEASIKLKEVASLLVVAMILLALMNKIPSMLAALVSGQIGGGAGSVGMGSAMAAAGAGAAVGGMVGAGVMGGAAQAGGGLAAMKAAMQSASQSMGASAGGAFSAASQSSGGGLASAMGTATNMAAEVGKSLGQGAASMAKEKASSVKEAMGERIGQTAGGKLAAKIRESGQQVQGNSPEEES